MDMDKSSTTESLTSAAGAGAEREATGLTVHTSGAVNATLKRQIGLFQATILVVGLVIGSGVFFKPRAVFAAAQAPGLGIVAWVVGCVLTVCGALSIAELGVAIPKAGGLFIYLRELFGELTAFLFGWAQVLIYYPAMSAALVVIAVTQMTSFVPMDNTTIKIGAILLLFMLMALNLISTKFTARFSTLFNVAKLIPIGVIIVFGIIMGKVHTFTPMVAHGSSTGSNMAGFGAALLGVLFAYDGWIAAANMAGELRDPRRHYAKSLIFGLIVITIAYVGVNVAVLNTMPLDQIAASNKVASDAAVILFGRWGEWLIALGIIISIIGCEAAFLLTAGRLPYAMSRDGLMPAPKVFVKVDQRSATPRNGIILETVLASLLVLVGSYDQLTDLLVFVNWLFFIVGIVGVFVLRARRKDLIKPGAYRVPLFPVVPIIGIVGAAYVLVQTLVSGAKTSLIGLGVVLVGVPAYFAIKRLVHKPDIIDETEPAL